MHFAHPSGSISRRQLSVFLAGTLCAGAAVAQSESGFPSKTVRLVVPFPAGGAGDQSGRELAKGLQSLWGQTVVVESKGGAGGLLAIRDVLRSQPVGYSLLFGQPGLVGNLHAFKDPQYRLEDFVVTGVMGVTFYALIVNAPASVRNVPEFVAYARANPGKLNYGSIGPSTGSTILAERFKQAAGIDIVMVPFKGGDPVSQALLAGDIHAYFATLNVARTRMRSPQIRGLAVTAEQRSQILPDLPTFRELGYPNVVLSSWTGVFAPAVAPAAIIQRLKEAMARVSASPETKAQLLKQEIEPWSGTLEQFSAYIKAEGDAIGADFKRLNIPVLD